MQNSSEPFNISQYWNILRRRRRIMFVVAVSVWAVACALAWLLPPRYRSQASILIEKPKVPKQYVVPNIESDPEQQMQTLSQQILSRSRLQGIINDLHLYTGRLAALIPGDPVDQMRKDIQIDLTQTTSKPPELIGFTISYTGTDPKTVQKVTSRLTSLFIEENLQAREQQSEGTTGFLGKELEDARAGLEEQTKKIKAFKAQYIGQLPGELQSNLQILSGMQMRLQQANEGLNRSEQQRLYLTSLLSAYKDSPSMANTGAQNAIAAATDPDTQIARLKSQLADLKSRYTDKHPEVLQIEDEIAKAEKLKAEMNKDVSDESGLPVARGVAELKSQLKGTELDIENRKKEIVHMQAAMQGYEDRLKGTPMREQQLADLTRDFDQSRKNYDALLAKKDDSAMATNLEKAQQGEQFAILDPPTFPVNPYFPNRLLVTLGGLAVGLGAAFGSAFTREALDDRIHVDKEVGTLSKMPILVTIPPLITDRDITKARWRRAIEMTCAGIALILMTGSALVAYMYT